MPSHSIFKFTELHFPHIPSSHEYTTWQDHAISITTPFNPRLISRTQYTISTQHFSYLTSILNVVNVSQLISLIPLLCNALFHFTLNSYHETHTSLYHHIHTFQPRHRLICRTSTQHCHYKLIHLFIVRQDTEGLFLDNRMFHSWHPSYMPNIWAALSSESSIYRPAFIHLTSIPKLIRPDIPRLISQ